MITRLAAAIRHFLNLYSPEERVHWHRYRPWLATIRLNGVWYDTDDGHLFRRWTGTGWEYRQKFFNEDEYLDRRAW